MAHAVAPKTLQLPWLPAALNPVQSDCKQNVAKITTLEITSSRNFKKRYLVFKSTAIKKLLLNNLSVHRQILMASDSSCS